MTIDYEFSAPSPAAQTRSLLLGEHICERIAANGKPLPFATFMDLALYHPQFGYYNAPDMTLGRAGDFTTAPEISPLFAQCFARQVSQLDEAVAKNVMEIGAGTGQFAGDFLAHLRTLNALPDHYYILEISPSLREKQRNHLLETVPELASRVIWLETLPDAFAGVILANEVLDALPTHVFHIQSGRALERCIAWDNQQFIWQDCAPQQPELAEKAAFLQQHYSLPNGYISEINLRHREMIQALAQRLTSGIMFFTDYGYGQQEYYHPQRHRGTLTCFYQHHRHQNPLIFAGLQDITAHVDFTNIIDMAADTGCSLEGFTSQGSFLLSAGILELAATIENQLTPAQAFSLHQAIKTLTLPSEMGDVVKVMAISKNLPEISELTLSGFQLQDRSRDL